MSEGAIITYASALGSRAHDGDAGRHWFWAAREAREGAGNQSRCSTTYATHRAGGRDEIRFTDMMAQFLLQHDLAQPFRNLVVIVASSHSSAQIMFADAK